jgi:hypothetical protein
MDWLNGVSIFVTAWPSTCWKKARTRAASLVSSVRGTSSPSARASRSWRDLSWARRSAPGGLTKRQPEDSSVSSNPSSVARDSRAQDVR